MEHTHTFNGPFSGTTQVNQYQKGKTNLDFTEARDSEWLWQQLGHMQVCTSLQTDNHASTPPLLPPFNSTFNSNNKSAVNSRPLQISRPKLSTGEHLVELYGLA